MKTLQVRYFAVLREQRGLAEETLSTEAPTPEALYEELRHKYRFTLPATRLRYAVEGEFAAPATLLKSGDTVVFVPPVAGG